MVSKAEYRERRGKGLRGQGDKDVEKFTPVEGSHRVLAPGQGLVSVNRQQARRRVIDRTMTRKGYRHGVRMKGGPEVESMPSLPKLPAKVK